jgi:diguanylate cyclase (GGDEF)-like protein
MKIYLDSPKPKNEEARLTALHTYAILDTLPEESFNDIAKLAAHVCGTDKSMVSFIDETRKWHKAKHNIAPIEVPRDFAICSRTILTSEPLIVNDTLENPETKLIGMVCNPPYVRFYAGVPLLTENNLALGTLCVVDTKPREINKEQVVALEMLARQVMQLLKLHQSVIQLEQEKHELEASKSELKLLNKQLEHISTTDELTSLRNRRSFTLISKNEITRSNETGDALSLIIIDIDHFKRFNDTHGHAFGDKVLAKVAAILKEQTANGHFCARYGGEEFIVLMPKTSISEATLYAEKYRHAISSANLKGHSIKVSIGIAQHKANQSPNVLFQSADTALFQAKAEGRNCVRIAKN